MDNHFDYDREVSEFVAAGFTEEQAASMAGAERAYHQATPYYEAAFVQQNRRFARRRWLKALLSAIGSHLS